MIILLPPSEGKATGGTPRTGWDSAAGLTGPALGTMRDTVAAALRRTRGGDEKLPVSYTHLTLPTTPYV